MSEPTSNSECYEIRVQGHLHARWSTWFDGLTVTKQSHGRTLIRGNVVDQAALHGLLRKLADLGLPLVSVTHIGPAKARNHTTTTTE